MKDAAKITDKILGSKVKFRRAMIILGVLALVTCYGFYTGAIPAIIGALFGGK